jgi:hypothetical protein
VEANGGTSAVGSSGLGAACEGPWTPLSTPPFHSTPVVALASYYRMNDFIISLFFFMLRSLRCPGPPTGLLLHVTGAKAAALAPYHRAAEPQLWALSHRNNTSYYNLQFLFWMVSFHRLISLASPEGACRPWCGYPCVPLIHTHFCPREQLT